MNTKILLVDDEERILQTFARTLGLGGYAVITAESGSEGLALYHQEQPDIVLLDLRMPGMSGLEVLQAIREDDPEANVILCTAHGDKDAVIAALRAGASDFLPKPIDQVTLESVLRRAEERIHLKRELRASREALRQQNVELEATVEARTEELRETVAQLRERVKEMTCLYAVSHDMQEDVSVDELCQRIIGHLIPAMEFPEITVPVIEMNGQRFHPPDRTENRSHSLSAEINVEGETMGQLWVTYTEERPFLIPEAQDLVNGVTEALSTWLERRRAEDALQASERRFRTLFDAMIEGVALHEVIYNRAGAAADYVLLDANPAYERHTGIPVEEAKGQRASELYGMEEPPYLDRYARVAETGEPITFETYFPPLSRHFSISVFSPAEGQFATVFEDVTERRETEEALRQSEERYRRLAENSPDMIYRMSLPDGRYEYMSPAATELTGYSPEVFYDKPFLIRDAFHPDWQSYFEEQWDRLLAGDVPPTYEYQIVHRDGDVRWINQRNVLVTGEEGQPVAIEGILTDVTERKEMEEALRESLIKYRVLFDTFPLGITIADREGKILEANPISERLLGISLEEHTARDIDGEEWHIIRPDGSPMPAEEYASVRALKEGKLVSNVEAGVVKPDGEITWLSVTAAPLRDDRVVITYNDITDRKRAEEALEQAHMKQVEDLRWLSRTALHLLSLTEASEILEYAARALQEKLGDCFVWPLTRTSDGQALRLGSLPGIDSSLLERAVKLIGFDPRGRAFGIVPEFREIYQQGLLFRHEGGLTEFAASQVPRPVGEALAKLLGVHDVYTIGLVGREQVLGNLHIATRSPELVENPELIESFARQVALTLEQATANDALEESEEKLRNIVEHSTNLFYAHTPDHQLTYLSPQSWSFLDCGPEEAMVRWTEFTTDHPVNQAGFALTEKAIETGEAQPPYDLELIGKKGRKIWVEVHEAPVVEDGRTIAIVGALTDITERKRAEEALRQSEERYRSLYTSIRDAILVADTERRIIDCNPAFVDLFGYTLDEIEGRKTRYIYKSEEQFRQLGEALRERVGDPNFFFTVNYRTKSGEVFPGETNVFYLRDGDEDIVGFVGLIRDITERKQAEDRLRFQAQLLDAVGQAVIATDLSGDIIYWNRAAEDVYGWSEGAVIGRNILDVTPAEGLVDQAAEIMESLQAGERWSGEFTVQRKDGSRFPAIVTDFPLQDEEGDLVGIVGITTDITQLKEAERQLREYAQHLEEMVAETVEELETEHAKAVQMDKLAALGEMAIGVIHELNQPLTAIRFEVDYLEMLGIRAREEHAGDLNAVLDVEGLKEIVEGMKKDLARCRRLADHLRDFGRISQDSPVVISLNCPIEDSFILVGTRLRDHDVEVRLDLADDLPSILAHPHRLEQVFLNLITNAEHAMERKAVEQPAYQKVLEITTTVDGDEVIAIVQDNGCGMPEEVCERIFDPFFTTKPEGEGTGLGLSISYGIVTSYDGEITCESVEDEGATFTLRFPVADAGRE